jgi:hypothetical protein
VVAIENGLPAAGVDLCIDLPFDLPIDPPIDPVEGSRRFRRLGSLSVRLLSSAHRLCLFCKYRIGSHAANIGRLRVRGLSECCGQTKFACGQSAAINSITALCGRTCVVLDGLLKNSRDARRLPSAAEAVTENKAFIAAVNRCATQEQGQSRVFQQTVKAD